MGVKEMLVENFVEKNMMDYSAYSVLQRAIPDLRDGMKPVHRRVIYTMFLEKATKLTKSANIEGATMKLHPHGSAYGTIVNMVQKDRNLLPLIDGKGNFAQATSRDMEPGASRYTEIKLSDAAKEMLKGLDKNLVDFIPNYDGTKTMPEVLPVKFPLLLANPSNGVAVGMASTIPSFNLNELTKAMVKYIREGKKSLLVPDFASGGFIVNDKETFKKINLQGSGTIRIRGKAEIKGNDIYITEFPFSTTREAIVDKVVDGAKNGKLKEVSDVKDLTDLKGPLVKVKCKRGSDMKMVLEKLYQLTPLQSTHSTNLNVIVNESPKVLGVWEAIEEWIEWRKQTIVRGLEFEIDKMQKELHLLRGLKEVLLDIDKAIEIIRHSKGELIEKNLMEHFKIDETQATYVANMKLRNINEDYIIKRLDEVEQLEDKIKDYKDIVGSDERQSKLVVKGLEESSEKYGRERQSQIIEVNQSKIKNVKKKLDQAPNYAVRLYITKEGYVKKSKGEGHVEKPYLKPGDKITDTFVTMNREELLVFGKDRCCHKIKIEEIDENSPKQLGTYIPSLCEVDEIVGVSVLDSKNKFIIIGYDNNKIAKIKLDSFSSNRKKLSNSLADNAEVVGILTYSQEGSFKFITTKVAEELMTSGFDAKDRWTKGNYGPRKGVLKELKY